MKPKIFLFALATIAAISIGASRISAPAKSDAKNTGNHTAPIGGLAIDEK
jgi:hypothetical protein